MRPGEDSDELQLVSLLQNAIDMVVTEQENKVRIKKEQREVKTAFLASQSSRDEREESFDSTQSDCDQLVERDDGRSTSPSLA